MASDPKSIGDQAIALYRKGELAEALTLLDSALKDGAEPRLLLLSANLLQAAKRFPEAVTALDQVVALAPDLAEAWSGKADLLSDEQRFNEALENYDRALALKPGFAEGWYNRGVALRGLERDAEAAESFARAAALRPNYFQAWHNRGLAQKTLGRHEEALKSFDQSLTINPRQPMTWLERGDAAWRRHRLEDAVQSYERALALEPRLVSAWTNRGTALRDLRRIPEALASYSQALALAPDALTYCLRGLAAWMHNHDYDAAVPDLEEAVRLDPDCPNALGSLLLIKQHGGDWRHFDRDVSRIVEGIRASKELAEPFILQAISSSPTDLQACATLHIARHYPAQTLLTPGPRKPGKIRVGYVSADFRAQATAQLMAGVYEHHDREKFEITAFDNGWNDHSAMRLRLEASFDKWVNIAPLSDNDAARAIADTGIDVLVNLNGWFGNPRMRIFAQHPARLQVNFLGFPGTLGAPYIDYIIADKIVLPEEEREFFTEKIAWLPHSYQANDSKNAIAPEKLTRAQCGLPETGFVFCNFNVSYKLTPSTFSSWMRVLADVPGSVLWLLDFHPRFSENLRREAEAQGVAASRLIFAPFISIPAHLSRLALADLALDSLPYNAHTTASDALWAGVPLLTRKGTAFAGRVGASLLTAIGLPELVTENEVDFENLAVRLAREPTLSKSFRDRLAENRLTMPLFDTGLFTRHLETAYETMLERWERGEKPNSFAV